MMEDEIGLRNKKPGKIENWSPAQEYISENQPERRSIEYSSSNKDMRQLSARGRAASDAVYEIASQPWKNYFDDVDSVPGVSPDKLTSSRSSSVTNRPRSILKKKFNSTDSKNDPSKVIKGRVIYAFKSRSSRELTVNKDDEIIVIENLDEHWVECKLGTRQGIIPRAYIEVGAENVQIIEYGQAVAKFDFVAKSSSQISFKKGQNLTLIRKIDQNWYEGRISNQEKGHIPINFLDIIQEPINSKNRQGRQSAPGILRSQPRPNSHQSCLSEVSDDDVFGNVMPEDLNQELTQAVNQLSTLAMRVSEEFDELVRENKV